MFRPMPSFASRRSVSNESLRIRPPVARDDRSLPWHQGDVPMQVLTKETTMKVTKLSEFIGAEVTGIDLRQPVDAETRSRLNEAVVENIALVIRDQHFTPDQFLAAVSLFGTPME